MFHSSAQPDLCASVVTQIYTSFNSTVNAPFVFQVHHEKELEHLKRMMDRKEDDLLKNQTLERKALPKRIRQEMKAREQMFRASMRISVTNLNEVMNPTEEKDRLKKVGKPRNT